MPKLIATKLFLKNDEPQIVISLPARAEEGETEILEGMIKKVVVARLPSESVAVMTFVPGGWAETLKVAEKVPLLSEVVVVIIE